MNGDNGQPKEPLMNQIELSIIFDPNTKRVMVGGPLGEKMLCYDILRLAWNAVAEFNPAKAGGGILVPKMQIVPGGKR